MSVDWYTRGWGSWVWWNPWRLGSPVSSRWTLWRVSCCPRVFPNLSETWRIPNQPLKRWYLWFGLFEFTKSFLSRYSQHLNIDKDISVKNSNKSDEAEGEFWFSMVCYTFWLVLLKSRSLLIISLQERDFSETGYACLYARYLRSMQGVLSLVSNEQGWHHIQTGRRTRTHQASYIRKCFRQDCQRSTRP